MSLRFRLALIYSLIAFVLVGAVSGVTAALLIGALEQQFVSRLNERADSLASAFNNPRLGQHSPVPSGSLVMLVNGEGRIIYATSELRNLIGTQFAFNRGGQAAGVFQLEDVADGQKLRVTTRELGERPGQGFVWVALPEGDLIASQRSAIWFLSLGLILAPLLTLLVGWAVGRHELRGLAEAARSAERLDPSASLASIPLPARRDEVYRLLEAINRLLARNDAQQAREKQLLGQIVHELGAPLTAIKAYLARAEARTGDPEVARAGLVAEELSFTTQDLMQLARGQMELTLALHLVPAGRLRERLDRLVPGVRFTGDWGLPVLCDPDRLVQALRNLLANARRAAGGGGTVELCLEAAGGDVRFHVRDSGPGLPEALGERIFEPFVSGSGSSGLGLSVARQIAERHGGRLSATNHPGGGAEFVLSIPDVTFEEPEGTSASVGTY